jgi:UDP-glucose 4-epimerase
VAADGVLLLSQAIRRAGRVPLPVPPPAVGSVGRALAGRPDRLVLPEQLRLLDFGRVVDTTRLRTAFGFTRAGPPRRPSTTSCAAARSDPLLGRERCEEAERLVDRGVHAAARLLAGLGRRT